MGIFFNFLHKIIQTQLSGYLHLRKSNTEIRFGGFYVDSSLCFCNFWDAQKGFALNADVFCVLSSDSARVESGAELETQAKMLFAGCCWQNPKALQHCSSSNMSSFSLKVTVLREVHGF